MQKKDSVAKEKPIRLKGSKYQSLQIYVLLRDNYTCQSCGVFTQNDPHHIIFRSQGGSDTEENLITLCVRCHAKAHGVKLVSD